MTSADFEREDEIAAFQALKERWLDSTGTPDAIEDARQDWVSLGWLVRDAMELAWCASRDWHRAQDLADPGRAGEGGWI